MSKRKLGVEPSTGSVAFPLVTSNSGVNKISSLAPVSAVAARRSQQQLSGNNAQPAQPVAEPKWRGEPPSKKSRELSAKRTPPQGFSTATQRPAKSAGPPSGAESPAEIPTEESSDEYVDDIAGENGDDIEISSEDNRYGL